MKRMFGMFMAVVFCGTLLGAVNLYAEETVPPAGTPLKDEWVADREKVKAQHETMKTDAQAAHSEEKTP